MKNNTFIKKFHVQKQQVKKSGFIKEQEAKGLLSNYGLKTSFKWHFILFFLLEVYNEWNNKP